MKARKTLLLAPAAALPLALAAAPAWAASSASPTYTATLKPVPGNGADGASGTITISLKGSTATIREHVSGLAETFQGNSYPHVQHIHGDAQGMCPTASADKNGDGVIDTVEGKPSYGGILTTLSTSGDTSPKAGTNVKTAPSGGSFDYSRTVDLDSATVQALRSGTAVVVVHGLDPATAPKAATTKKSNLVPSLPLAATSPALCGVVQARQMSAMPSGGVNTGGTAPSDPAQLPLYLGGGLALAAAGGLALRLRRSATAGQR
ncbi:MAG: hypothetical protein ACTHOD_16840 [Motilibacteraceae bacterium]